MEKRNEAKPDITHCDCCDRLALHFVKHAALCDGCYQLKLLAWTEIGDQQNIEKTASVTYPDYMLRK